MQSQLTITDVRRRPAPLRRLLLLRRLRLYARLARDARLLGRRAGHGRVAATAQACVDRLPLCSALGRLSVPLAELPDCLADYAYRIIPLKRLNAVNA